MKINWKQWRDDWINYALDTGNKELFEIMMDGERAMWYLIRITERVEDLIIEMERIEHARTRN